MSDSARVTSIDALRELRTALALFGEAIELALGEARSEVQRASSWLENDRVQHWKMQLRQRKARLSDAQGELMRAQIAAQDGLGSAVLERNNVAKWKRAVEEAEWKLQTIKKWRRDLEREVALFRGKCQPMARMVEGDVPKALAKLERYATALDKYAKLSVSTSKAGEGSPPPTDGEASEGMDA